MASTKAPPTGRYQVTQPRPAEPAEPRAFPGCTPVHLPRTEIERFEGRLEYWDSATETAWISEPTTSYHERPSRLVTRLAEMVGRVRGSPIARSRRLTSPAASCRRTKPRAPPRWYCRA